MAEIKSRRIVYGGNPCVMVNDLFGRVVFVMAIIHFVMAERLRDQILRNVQISLPGLDLAKS